MAKASDRSSLRKDKLGNCDNLCNLHYLPGTAEDDQRWTLEVPLLQEAAVTYPFSVDSCEFMEKCVLSS